MTIYLREQIKELSQLILNAQKIKGDNKSNPIHTTAGMNAKEELDQSLYMLIDSLKSLRENLIGEESRIQSNLWQVNCYLQDAIKQNNKNMNAHVAKWENAKEGGKNA
mgnify:FL=1|tara:strand:+ start:587 stop:910 length:324 start_codon:yes stop_codon:yes gene_type:complete